MFNTVGESEVGRTSSVPSILLQMSDTPAVEAIDAETGAPGASVLMGGDLERARDSPGE